MHNTIISCHHCSFSLFFSVEVCPYINTYMNLVCWKRHMEKRVGPSKSAHKAEQPPLLRSHASLQAPPTPVCRELDPTVCKHLPEMPLFSAFGGRIFSGFSIRITHSPSKLKFKVSARKLNILGHGKEII